jgi:hypothetical protein
MGGVNLYAFVNNEPTDWVDPLGLSVNYYKRGKDGVLVPFEPSAKQKERFDTAMQQMKDAAAVGLALYNWVSSDENTLKVVHTPGKPASEVTGMALFDKAGHRKLFDDEVPGTDHTPAIGVDLNEGTLCTKAPKNISKDLVHELSHAIIGLGEGWNIIFAENPARQARGLDSRHIYNGKDVNAWYQQQVQTMKTYVETVSQDVKSFISKWSGRKK